MNTTTLDEARAAKLKAMDLFGTLATVAGVGVTRTDGGYAVKVNLRKAPPVGVALPHTIDGVPVRVDVVGRIRKL